MITHRRLKIRLFNQTKQDKMQFLKESPSSKPRTIQKQTHNIAAASWVLPEGCVLETGVKVLLSRTSQHTTPQLAFADSSVLSLLLRTPQDSSDCFCGLLGTQLAFADSSGLPQDSSACFCGLLGAPQDSSACFC